MLHPLGAAPRGGNIFQLFYLVIITLVSRKFCWKFRRNPFIIARDIAYIKIGGGGSTWREWHISTLFYLKFITLV